MSIRKFRTETMDEFDDLGHYFDDRSDKAPVVPALPSDEQIRKSLQFAFWSTQRSETIIDGTTADVKRFDEHYPHPGAIPAQNVEIIDNNELIIPRKEEE